MLSGKNSTNELKLTGVSIGLTNPKSPTNVGAVMRAAGCFQVDRVLYSGKRYAQAAKFATDTKNVTGKIPLVACEDFLDAIDDASSLVCVDLVEGATPLPEFSHPDNALYVFGPEDGTLTQSIIDRADHVVYIPTIGCMNLAATVNVVLYDRLTKCDSVDGGDDLIRKSRDKNNNVKLRF